MAFGIAPCSDVLLFFNFFAVILLLPWRWLCSRGFLCWAMVLAVTSPARAGKNKKLLVGTSEMQDVHTHQHVETRARKEPEMGARHKYDVLKLSGGMLG